MSRGRLLLLPLLAVLFILGACQSEGKLKGEVFIVTEGRENIEMGLVDVKAYRASSLEEYLEKRHKQSQEEVQLRAQKAAAQLDSLSLAYERMKEREEEYEATKTVYNEARKQYRLSLEDYNSSLTVFQGDRVAVALGREVALRKKADFSSGRTGYMSEGDLGDVVDVKKEEGKYFYKIKSDGGEVGWSPYTDRLVEPDERIVSLRNESKDDMEGAKKLYQQAKVATNNISDRLRNTFRQTASYREQEYYFRNMPQPAVSDETGSDGKYELTVESGVPYYLVAQASRSVGDEEEQYYWMVKTTVDGGGEKELNLTNENLGGVADKKYALSERTLSTVRGIWNSSISLAKQGEELDWEKLIYRTAFPDDTTDAPIPDDLDVPEEKLLSDR